MWKNFKVKNQDIVSSNTLQLFLINLLLQNCEAHTTLLDFPLAWLRNNVSQSVKSCVETWNEGRRRSF